MKKIFLFIADGFEEVEAVTPLDYLRRCGADLTLVGVGAKVIRSSRGLTVTCDITLSELIGEGTEAKKNAERLTADTALAILPGGLPNSRTLSENTELCYSGRSVYYRLRSRSSRRIRFCLGGCLVRRKETHRAEKLNRRPIARFISIE